MTIAVSVKVGEGLVLAADSTTSFFSGDVLAQSYHHARKVLQLGDYPIGLLTYGLGQLAGRNLESLIAEFEQRDLAEFDPKNYTVRDIANTLHRFIAAKYDEAFPPLVRLPLEGEAGAPDGADAPPDAPPPDPEPDRRMALGIVMGGYSAGEFFPDEFGMVVPYAPPTEVWPDIGERREQYGIRWWGQTRPIERLYLGCDTDAVNWFVENGVSEEDAWQYYSQLRDRLIWPIIYEGMPLQDAVDLAVYLVNVTIGHSRFAVGPPVCGGKIDVATITARGFRWVSQKNLVVKADSLFF